MRIRNFMAKVLFVVAVLMLASTNSLANEWRPVPPEQLAMKSPLLEPDGFAVDEIPKAVKLDVPFGSYMTSYEIKDGHLHFKRSLVVKSATIPAGEYDTVRKFFGAVLDADQLPVVLVKK